MSHYLMQPMSWTELLLFLVLWHLLYVTFRPVRDYYILQRRYYDRRHDVEWLFDHKQARGEFSSHYEGFDDYAAAKVVFELYETAYIGGLDTCWTEAEHQLFMVPARSKAAAIARLKAGKAFGKQVLHETPHADIMRRREHWQKYRKELDAEAAEAASTAE